MNLLAKVLVGIALVVLLIIIYLVVDTRPYVMVDKCRRGHCMYSLVGGKKMCTTACMSRGEYMPLDYAKRVVGIKVWRVGNTMRGGVSLG